MVANPWYLLALGILLLLVGSISASLSAAARSSGKGVDSRMSDAEIARRLESRSSMGWTGAVFYLGMLCVIVSLVWRLVWFFL